MQYQSLTSPFSEDSHMYIQSLMRVILSFSHKELEVKTPKTSTEVVEFYSESVCHFYVGVYVRLIVVSFILPTSKTDISGLFWISNKLLLDRVERKR